MTTLSPNPSRRTIRFAPLPDPRRAVLITDDGTELPFSPLHLDVDYLNSKLNSASPSTSAFDLPSIPASMSISALNSPTQTPLTPQSWKLPLPSLSSLPSPLPPPSPAHVEKTFSAESDSSNSSNGSGHSNSSSSGSTSGSPPTSEISSSASSMYSLTPTQSIDPYSSSTGSSTPTQPIRKSRRLAKYSIPAEQILTLGAINLFRSRPKGKDKERDSDTDSIQSAHGWGNALTRWTSGGSGGLSQSGGIPMYRTQSTQSYQGNVRSPKRSSSPASLRLRSKSQSNGNSSKLNPAHESGMLSTLHTGTTKKGTRMLNGRVYGARRGSASGTPVNPFANAKDDPDPEFVEWGYGGMGSVKNVRDGVGGKVWGRVVGDGTAVYGSEGSCSEKTNGRAAQNVRTEDEDDGSGMGWVRKRREAREREAREQAEREAKEQAEKEKHAKESQGKSNENDTNEQDVPDSRSISSATSIGTTGTATSTATSATVRNIPIPLPLPDVGDVHPPSADSADSVGSATPTLGSTMVTPTQSLIGTPKPRAIEAILSLPNSGDHSDPTTPSDIRAAPISRQGSNAPTISNGGSGSSPKDHMMTTVNIPAPTRHHHSHSHHHSRGKSLESALKALDLTQRKTELSGDKLADPEAAIGERAATDEDITATDDQKEDDAENRGSLEDVRRKPRHDSVSSSSSSASSISSQSGSESESDSEKNAHDSDEDDDEDDEDEESEEEKSRKTSLGAGVEKISRHK